MVMGRGRGGLPVDVRPKDLKHHLSYCVPSSLEVCLGETTSMLRINQLPGSAENKMMILTPCDVLLGRPTNFLISRVSEAEHADKHALE